MKTLLISKDNLIAPSKSLSICLGYFDGVHLGHQKIIKKASESHKYETALLTFDKPVSSLLDNSKSKEVLTSLDDRFRLISRYGIDYYLVMSIDKEFLSLEADEFISLLKKMNVKEVFVGDDYHFGKDQKGDVSLLKKHFDVNVVEQVKLDDKKVSTQRIVSMLKDGDVKSANKLLGHNYLISGSIIEGHHNGEKFGIRTANVKMSTNYVIPKLGVYKIIAYIDGLPHKAIANVGVHPTIDKEDFPILEVHLPDYSSIDYSKSIMVEFLDFIREEKVFKSTDELIAQIKKDITLL